jgi:type IV pilus assembly protein PilE
MTMCCLECFGTVQDEYIRPQFILTVRSQNMRKIHQKLERLPSRVTGDRTLAANGQGWTLAELLITLCLMSVLAALALPTYQQQQRQARRSDGHAALLQLQMDQVRWRSHHDLYTDSLTDLGWSSDSSPQGHYRITVTEATAEAYSAEATALGAQAADQECNPLRLRWQGSATAVWGAGAHADSDPARCWRR